MPGLGVGASVGGEDGARLGEFEPELVIVTVKHFSSCNLVISIL